MKTDVVIIGGGIVGCSTAYYLAKKGRKVTLLEKEAGVGLEASGRCACGVRQQGRTAGLPLAMAAVRLWATLSQELNCDLEYVRTGNLKIILSQARQAELEAETPLGARTRPGRGAHDHGSRMPCNRPGPYRASAGRQTVPHRWHCQPDASDASLRASRRPPGRADQGQHTGHRFAYARFNRLRGDHPER